MPQPQLLTTHMANSLLHCHKDDEDADAGRDEKKPRCGEIDLELFSHASITLPRSSSELSINPATIPQVAREIKPIPIQSTLQHLSDQQYYQGQYYNF